MREKSRQGGKRTNTLLRAAPRRAVSRRTASKKAVQWSLLPWEWDGCSHENDFRIIESRELISVRWSMRFQVLKGNLAQKPDYRQLFSRNFCQFEFIVTFVIIDGLSHINSVTRQGCISAVRHRRQVSSIYSPRIFSFCTRLGTEERFRVIVLQG